MCLSFSPFLHSLCNGRNSRRRRGKSIIERTFAFFVLRSFGGMCVHAGPDDMQHAITERESSWTGLTWPLDGFSKSFVMSSSCASVMNSHMNNLDNMC